MPNITILRGETVEWDLPLVNYGTTNPTNLTGATIWLVAKSDTSLADSAAEVRLDNSTQGGITIAAPLSGIAHVTLTAAQTHALTPGALLEYAVKVKESSGRETFAEQGWLQVKTAAVDTV